MDPHRFGFVTVVGPPNAGKSTLVNRLTGTKVSIVSRKPQTTRHRILGIRTLPQAQVVFVDTPGLHFDQRNHLNRQMNRTARASLDGVDLIAFMMDHGGWTSVVEHAFQPIQNLNTPVLLLINKIDRLTEKATLLPLIEKTRHRHNFLEIVPISALNENLDQVLLPLLVDLLPVGAAGFPAGQISDRGSGFYAAELLREQMFTALGDELPYQSAIELTEFDQSNAEHWRLEMTIWVERESQKKMVIGKNGQTLKKMGQRARVAMEHRFGVRIRLNVWVKIEQGWGNRLSMLRSLGYAGE